MLAFSPQLCLVQMPDFDKNRGGIDIPRSARKNTEKKWYKNCGVVGLRNHFALEITKKNPKLPSLEKRKLARFGAAGSQVPIAEVFLKMP